MKHSRAYRSAIAVVIAVIALIAGSTAPAFAGTLTSASFTASTPYTYTNAQNTRYDWGFTTATTSTLSKVTATVPAGTGGSNRYLAVTGTAGNSATTPDSAAISLTGDIDLRASIAPTVWNTGTVQRVIIKTLTGGNSNNSYRLSLLNGNIYIGWADGSTNDTNANSTTTVPFTNGQAGWIRATLDVNNGSGGLTTTFYTSTDGSSWTQLGSQVTYGWSTSIYDGSDPLSIGAGGSNFNGKIYYGEVRNGIGGTVVAKFDPMQATAAQAAAGSWAASTGETWTVNRSGANQPADIATDLNVGPVTGVPTGGTANYRFIDGTVNYYFPTATSINSGTPCAINLGGFVNTATAGNYSSLIKTWDNAGTPAVVDSVTTATLAITDYSSSQNIAAIVEPSFSFTVANQSSACNGESNFVTTAGTATTVALGHLAMSSNTSGGQALTVSSNANSGFSVYVRGTQATQNLRSTGYNWTDVSGTYASPAALGAGEKFGYTYEDSTASTSVTNPGSATFAKLDNASTNKVMGSTTSQSGSGCVTFDAQTGSATPAGSYSATVVYTAIPAF